MKAYPNFDDKVIRPVYFMDIAFNSGDFQANSSDRNIVWNGITWYGVGDLGTINAYEITSGTQASTMKFALAGIPTELTQDVLNENSRNKNVTCYMGLLDANNQLIFDPFIWFRGTIDSLSVTLGTSIAVAGSASSKLINWARSVNSRYTDEQQQAMYPGDRGFKFIADIINLKLQWGS